jgi:hypothetical protein
MRLTNVRGFFGRLIIAIATGYIWFFYSERVFWSFWRRGEDTFGSFFATWAVYAIAAYICLILIQQYKARSVWAMFLVGAFFGWLVEGVFAMTLFGAEGIPFPFTISWTGLAWHAIISVVLGWYVLQQALTHSFKRTAWVSGMLGIFWGTWSIFWSLERAEVVPVDAYVLHAFAVTVILICMQCMYGWLGMQQFSATRLEKITVGLLAVLWFGFVTVPTFGALAAVLPVLFGVLYLALRKNKKTETRQSFLATLDAPITYMRSFAVLLMPLCATLIYALAQGMQLAPPTNFLVLGVTLPAGFILLGVSLWKVFRAKK